MTAFIVQVEWSHDDQAFAAALVRDGEPWYLDGALVGMGTTREQAVTDLTGIARHLVITGANYLTSGPLPVPDRRWLLAVLGDGYAPPDGELLIAGDMFRALDGSIAP